MPEIEFTINQTTGEMEVHIKGIPGPACENVAQEIEKLVGRPTKEEKTREYLLKPIVRPQNTVQGRR